MNIIDIQILEVHFRIGKPMSTQIQIQIQTQINTRLFVFNT